ncbi:hypothetical protein ACXWRW_12120, partial [Streptococcus pyogenes]
LCRECFYQPLLPLFLFPSSFSFFPLLPLSSSSLLFLPSSPPPFPFSPLSSSLFLPPFFFPLSSLSFFPSFFPSPLFF